MKVDLNVYSNNDVEKTVSSSKSMDLSANARAYIFKMFSSSIYSNPIGTVVREITSNCFDAHVEAGVNYPVLIKKTFNDITNTHYLSFIDYGVGISPERMYDVCAVYFESTKSNSDDQIGGYGIGMKSPLAYKRLQEDGSFDNSYYAITNYNGIKYMYCIHDDSYSPVISLMYEEETTDANGTEVRIPILQKDLKTFEAEIVRQLYYFDNLVFDGFDNDEIANDYTIVRCKNFLYRGDGYSDEMHICLGKVAYPIDYRALKISEYDYQIPVALKFNIGEINVTTSREALEYSEKTIGLIKAKLIETKNEILDMITAQYDDVVTYKDYLEYLNRFGMLHFTEDIQMSFDFITAKDLKLRNFKYSNIKLPTDAELFSLFYEMTPNGTKRDQKNNNYVFTGSLKKLSNGNVFLIDDTYERVRSVVSFLKSRYPVYYTIQHKPFDVSDMKKIFDCLSVDLIVNGEYTDMYNTIFDLFNEFSEMVKSGAKIYSEIVVPPKFKVARQKREKFSGEITLNMVSESYVNRQTIDFKKLYEFKGTVVYSAYDEIEKLKVASKIYNGLFEKSSATTQYYKYAKNPFYANPKTKNFVLFVAIAKNKLRMLKGLKDIVHVDDIYNRFFYRKKDIIINSVNAIRIRELYNSINDFYRHRDLYVIFPDIARPISEALSFIRQYPARDIIGNSYLYGTLKRYYDLDKAPVPKNFQKHEKALNAVLEISNANSEVLSYLRVPGYSFAEDKIFCELAKKVLIEK